MEVVAILIAATMAATEIMSGLVNTMETTAAIMETTNIMDGSANITVMGTMDMEDTAVITTMNITDMEETKEILATRTLERTMRVSLVQGVNF